MSAENGSDSAEGWMALRRVPMAPPVTMAVISPIFNVAITTWLVTSILLPGLPLWVRFAIPLGAAVLGCVAIPIIASIRRPQVRVNLADGLIQAGRRVSAFEDLSIAHVLVASSQKKRAISLLLEDGAGLHAAINLRDQNEQPLTDAESRALGEVVERSSIHMPTAREDPRGSFSRFNFPTNVTKADAIALVANPPRFADPLPIPPAV